MSKHNKTSDFIAKQLGSDANYNQGGNSNGTTRL